MANRPATYHFEVRVNWDKLLAIDEKNESFKAQLFFEAVLTHPREVEPDDKDALETVFKRATVENSLAPPPPEKEKPKLEANVKMDENKETYTEWKFSWLLFGDFDQALDMRDFPLDSQDLTVMLRFGWLLCQKPSHAFTIFHPILQIESNFVGPSMCDISTESFRGGAESWNEEACVSA